MDYTGKRVAILGLSIEGTDSAKYFLSHGAHVICCDRRTKEELGSVYDDLSSLGASFSLGETYLSDLDHVDIAVRTPGMNPRIPQIERLKNNGKLTSQTKLLVENLKNPIIGITGTKGKGTTSTLIAKILEASGKKVHLGGNVGIPLLFASDTFKDEDWVVLELSSFQLEDCIKSPHIAVVLRITQEHLQNQDTTATNFHPDREVYIQAKSPIVRFQKPGDIAIINSGDPTAQSFAVLTPAEKKFFSRYGDADAYVANHVVYAKIEESDVCICTANDILLRGDHNLENIAAATLAAIAAGCPIEVIQSTVRTFSGLPHRIEFVGTVHGVSYYDDSFSTVPETTIAALESFTEPKVIILGGSDKGSDYQQMAEKIAHDQSIKAVILIGRMAQKIKDALTRAGYSGGMITGASTMKEIINQCETHAHPGDVVLLSPACASFDMFKNYKDRGDQFHHEVTSRIHP